jgi:general secretion pathway protein F
MGAFEFQALDSAGRRQRGGLQGDTARQVRQTLRDQGLSPLRVDAVAESTGRRGFGNGFNAIELSLVLRQMASLATAGLPLEEVLETVAEQAEKPSVKKIMVALRSRVMEGHALSSGMAEFPRAFPDLVRATVAAGEQSGRLDQVLSRLADYAEGREELGRKVLLAMLYPVILTLISVLVVTGLMGYVVPQVVEVFDSLQQELPALTRIMIALSDFLRDYGLVLGVVLLLCLLAAGGLMQMAGVRAAWHRNVLRVPVVGRLARGIQTARFTRTLSILSASGVPLLDALAISGQVISNLPMRRAVESVATRVREGTSLSRALNETRLFPPLVVRLIASGEKGGKLDDMLARSADNQEREVETSVSVLTGVLEPALILLMGGMVLIIVLAILLPILQMNQLMR